MNSSLIYEYLYSYKNNERSLWRAVILQAFVDLKNNSKKKIAKTYRLKSALWFNLKNEEFNMVCSFAGFEPKYVWEKAEKIKDSFYK